MTDTSTVERLAKWADGEAMAAYGENLVDDPEDHEGAQVANLIRALLAERDALQAKLDVAVDALNAVNDCITARPELFISDMDCLLNIQDRARIALAQITKDKTDDK